MVIKAGTFNTPICFIKRICEVFPNPNGITAVSFPIQLLSRPVKESSHTQKDNDCQLLSGFLAR